MTILFAEPCIGVKDTVVSMSVRSIASIRPKNETERIEKRKQATISILRSGIDCGAASPSVLSKRSFEEAAVPEKWKNFIQVDADWFKKKKG